VHYSSHSLIPYLDLAAKNGLSAIQMWQRDLSHLPPVTNSFAKPKLLSCRAKIFVTIQVTIRTLLGLSTLVVQSYRHSRTKASGR
jgi:hypothetical protein